MGHAWSQPSHHPSITALPATGLVSSRRGRPPPSLGKNWFSRLSWKLSERVKKKGKETNKKQNIRLRQTNLRVDSYGLWNRTCLPLPWLWMSVFFISLEDLVWSELTAVTVNRAMYIHPMEEDSKVSHYQPWCAWSFSQIVLVPECDAES